MSSFCVRAVRGTLPESHHEISAAVVDPGGRILAAVGAPDRMAIMRSAAKPFQALAAIESGALEAIGCSELDLALICASHNSEQYQVDGAVSLLHRCGGGEADLACGAHPSLLRSLGYYAPDEADDEVVLAPRSPLANNCVGKHSAMIATARHLGLPVDGYHREGHPVQVGCRDAVARACGVPPDRVREAVDGCAVRCFGVPVTAMARAYARLGAAASEPERVVRDAMTAHPAYVAGHRRLCTRLMAAYPGAVVAKVGAGGVYGAALPEPGLGIAIRVHDGNTVAAGVALLGVLASLDLLPGLGDRLSRYVRPAILNTRGHVVGHYEAAGSIAWK